MIDITAKIVILIAVIALIMFLASTIITPIVLIMSIVACHFSTLIFSFRSLTVFVILLNISLFQLRLSL